MNISKVILVSIICNNLWWCHLVERRRIKIKYKKFVGIKSLFTEKQMLERCSLEEHGPLAKGHSLSLTIKMKQTHEKCFVFYV